MRTVEFYNRLARRASTPAPNLKGCRRFVGQLRVLKGVEVAREAFYDYHHQQTFSRPSPGSKPRVFCLAWGKCFSGRYTRTNRRERSSFDERPVCVVKWMDEWSEWVSESVVACTKHTRRYTPRAGRPTSRANGVNIKCAQILFVGRTFLKTWLLLVIVEFFW